MSKKKKFEAPYGVETRAYTCALEARSSENSEEGIIEGHPIVYASRALIDGVWDEEIDPGALVGCDMKDVMLLVNHNRSEIPLARSRNNTENSTMQLEVREDGLHFRARIAKSNPRGAELLSAVSRGDIRGMSFGFIVGKDHWEHLDREIPLRHIEKIEKLIEVSAVNNPAYEASEISTRSLDCAREALESEKKALEKAREEARTRAEILKSLCEVKL